MTSNHGNMPNLMIIATVSCLLLLFTVELEGARACPYYGTDRFAQAEANLANCSWFGESACCKRTEVTSVFAEMFKLFEATKECENRLSYLMCYFCSPDQEIWFREKATICRSFCDSIFEHCGDALYEDKRINKIFTESEAFCKDNFFDVVDSEKDCYRYDPQPFDGQSCSTYNITLLLFLLMAVWKISEMVLD